MFPPHRPLLALLFLLPTPTSSTASPEGQAFLDENAKKTGVKTLPSGLQYRVLKKGTGDKHPLVNTPCSVNYEGTLVSGAKFDSSYDRGAPATFAPNQVIKGWTEAMQLMVVGDKWEMFIPSDLAYGDQGRPPKIPAKAVLIFKMEILAINGSSKPLTEEEKAARAKDGTQDAVPAASPGEEPAKGAQSPTGSEAPAAAEPKTAGEKEGKNGGGEGKTGGEGKERSKPAAASQDASAARTKQDEFMESANANSSSASEPAASPNLHVGTNFSVLSLLLLACCVAVPLWLCCRRRRSGSDFDGREMGQFAE